VLALSTACRHPVIAIAIASANYPEETRVPAAIVLYLLVNVAMCIPYIAWLRRASPTGGGEPHLAT
jgi:BASS family bile acid:Na+ symporter